MTAIRWLTWRENFDVIAKNDDGDDSDDGDFDGDLGCMVMVILRKGGEGGLCCGAKRQGQTAGGS